eukprot:scaffold531424_cov18-Prasinocladus_malaysianus.AAC.1
MLEILLTTVTGVTDVAENEQCPTLTRVAASAALTTDLLGDAVDGVAAVMMMIMVVITMAATLLLVPL